LIAVCFAFGALSPDSRKNILYRFAHQSDFSVNFACAGIDSKNYRALLITPDQRRALIAPALPNQQRIFQDKTTPSLMVSTRRPTVFPVVDCKPSIDFQCWSSAWSDWDSRWHNSGDALTFDRHLKAACDAPDESDKKRTP
jgi:hypothetical protein